MLSEDDLHVSWQVQRFGHVHVHSVCQAQHFRRAVLPDCEILRITMSGLRQLVQACTLFGRSGPDCLFAWLMQHLVKIRCVWGTVVFAVAAFPHWYGCARCHVTFVFHVPMASAVSDATCCGFDPHNIPHFQLLH